jgi:hypothetical protein
MALPSFAPSGPFVADVYVFRQIKACEESRAVGRETWKLVLNFSMAALEILW